MVATPERRRYLTCKKKTKYATEEACLQKIVTLVPVPSRKRPNPSLYAYQCVVCNLWHITRMSPEEAKLRYSEETT